MTYIVTSTGIQFDLVNIDPAKITIEDIATSLSKLCRFTGHCVDHYSVAQHCVLGAREIGKEHRLAFLLHDASEAYLSDISKPLKSLPQMAGYVQLEENLQAVICAKFGVQYPFHEEVKLMDLRMGSTEIRDLCGGDLSVWGEHASYEPISRLIEPWSWRRSYAEYMVELKVALEEELNFTFS